MRRFIQLQRRWCESFDKLLPAEWHVDGNREFVERVAGGYLFPEAVVYDIGGGKHPLINPELKNRLNLRVVGVDIDAAELAAAPAGCYDRRDCADILAYSGDGAADVVVCQALLEHVHDVERALGAIAATLKTGGVGLVFVPSRNAVFARLNLILPQAVKRALLHGLFPSSRGKQGFPAFYDRCTPAAMTAAAARQGLKVAERRLYFQSKYFSFFLPLHVAWRLWQVVFHRIAGAEAAETFTLVLRKPLTEHVRSGIAAISH